MRKLLLIMFLASPCLANGPKYNYDDPHLNDEMLNIYKDITVGAIQSSRIVGTSGNSSAIAGRIGQVLSSTTVSNALVAADGVYRDMAALSLTPGTWSVSAIAEEQNSGNWSFGYLCITATAGNSAAGCTIGDNYTFHSTPASNGAITVYIPSYVIAVNATTTYYLKERLDYTTGTGGFNGRISAIRVF